MVLGYNPTICLLLSTYFSAANIRSRRDAKFIQINRNNFSKNQFVISKMTDIYKRYEKSLGLLTTRFVSLLQKAKDGVLDLKIVSMLWHITVKCYLYTKMNYF
jgi:hypothetical protein